MQKNPFHRPILFRSQKTLHRIFWLYGRSFKGTLEIPPYATVASFLLTGVYNRETQWKLAINFENDLIFVRYDHLHVVTYIFLSALEL